MSINKCVIFVYKKSASNQESLLGLYSTPAKAERAINNYCEKYPQYFRKCFRIETRALDVDYL